MVTLRADALLEIDDDSSTERADWCNLWTTQCSNDCLADDFSNTNALPVLSLSKYISWYSFHVLATTTAVVDV